MYEPDVMPLSQAAQLTRETVIYYLSPDSVGMKAIGSLLDLRREDQDLFELAVIHHDETVKYSLKAFQHRFNEGLTSNNGLIVIK